MKKKMGFLFFGMIFGFTLSRVGASEYDLIYYMFTAENLKLAAVIGSAIGGWFYWNATTKNCRQQNC